MAGFQFFPEPSSQHAGDGGETRVVQSRLTLVQVVHEQVTHRLAGEVVAVDHLLDRGLPLACGEDPDRRGCVRREDSRRVQQLIEHCPVLGDDTLVGEERHTVPDRDVADGPSVAGQDDSQAVPGDAQHSRRNLFAACLGVDQGEPQWVPDQCHRGHQMPRCAAEHPS